MKTTLLLASGWSLVRLPPRERLNTQQLPQEGWLALSHFPMQVQDVLLEYGQLPQEVLVGWCDEAKWIAEYDWLYACEFDIEQEKRPARLVLHGVDTIADIYLNDRLIARHDDLFLPEDVDITGMLKAHNRLLIHFHNIRDAEKNARYAPEWTGMVDRWKTIRKPGYDRADERIRHGSNYQGAHPYFTPVGLYDDVELALYDSARIAQDCLRASVQADNAVGHVAGEFRIERFFGREPLAVRVTLTDERQNRIYEETVPVDGAGCAKHAGTVDRPMLWNPRGFGAQPLYTVQAELIGCGQGESRVLDRRVKQIGFRNVKMDGAFNFQINGKTVRLWGGSMDPFQGYTHCWQRDRVMRVLDMVENANMNTLRIWGQGIPYKDELYEEADRRGILIWQEFFLANGAYPEGEAFEAKIRAEAEYLVRRLRHHASLLLWCGGNETRMGAEFADRNRPFYGEKLITEVLPEVAARLDPERYYHENSPSGGRWANDPLEGDYHTYDCIWSYPDGEYPNMVSEHIRTSPPAMHSLKRIVREEGFWPDGYRGQFTYNHRFPLPDSWMERTNWPAMMEYKTGPIWEFYDADTPEEMLYRFGAAYALEMRRGLERVRMGSREGGLYRKRRCRGHFSCKLNDSWPKCYCAVIDFFGEGYMPYYATRRGQEPVLVCFDIRDHINLWLVNDSAEDIEGTVIFSLFDQIENRFSDTKEVRIGMPQGQSDIVMNLDFLQFFRKYKLLHARFVDSFGVTRSSVVDYVDIERHMRFPQARLTVRTEGNELLIETDRFARCVEICGNADGDAFGWMFEDNYFDLLPGECKRVRVLGTHRKGTITLKPHYSPYQTVVEYRA